MATAAVEIVVVSEIDPSEPALAEPADDPIAADLGGIDVGEVARICQWAVASRRFPTGSWSHPRSHSKAQRATREASVSDALLRFIHRSIPDDDRSL